MSCQCVLLRFLPDDATNSFNVRVYYGHVHKLYLVFFILGNSHLSVAFLLRVCKRVKCQKLSMQIVLSCQINMVTVFLWSTFDREVLKV